MEMLPVPPSYSGFLCLSSVKNPAWCLQTRPLEEAVWKAPGFTDSCPKLAGDGVICVCSRQGKIVGDPQPAVSNILQGASLLEKNSLCKGS